MNHVKKNQLFRYINKSENTPAHLSSLQRLILLSVIMHQTFGLDSVELLMGGMKAPCAANAGSAASLDLCCESSWLELRLLEKTLKLMLFNSLGDASSACFSSGLKDLGSCF